MNRKLLVLVLLASGWAQGDDNLWNKLRSLKVQTQLGQIAYDAIAATVQGKPINPKDSASRFDISIRAGCFVTIEIRGKLRGCMGTLFPTQPNLIAELVQAAIVACHDKRFRPLKPNELHNLSISITVVRNLKPLDDISSLLPEHGLVVKRGDRFGIVLPYEGKDPFVRLEWAKRKVGLKEGEPFEVWRLEGLRWQVSFDRGAQLSQ